MQITRDSIDKMRRQIKSLFLGVFFFAMIVISAVADIVMSIFH